MGSEDFTTLEVVGRRVPDESIDPQPDGSKISVPLPGNYEVGVEVGGVFLPLAVFKAGNIFNADGSFVNPPAASPPPSSGEEAPAGGDGGPPAS